MCQLTRKNKEATKLKVKNIMYCKYRLYVVNYILKCKIFWKTVIMFFSEKSSRLVGYYLSLKKTDY